MKEFHLQKIGITSTPKIYKGHISDTCQVAKMHPFLSFVYFLSAGYFHCLKFFTTRHPFIPLRPLHRKNNFLPLYSTYKASIVSVPSSQMFIERYWKDKWCNTVVNIPRSNFFEMCWYSSKSKWVNICKHFFFLNYPFALYIFFSF